MMSSLTIFTVILAVLSSLIIADDPCRYEYPGKGIIDLTTLGRTDGIAAYPDEIPQTGSGYKYSYNPCKPFSEGDNCINVSACQVSLDGAYTFILGTQESAQWSPGSGLGIAPQISYSSGEKKVTVLLICGTHESNVLEALGEDPINNYKFRLTHKCACWDGCSTSPQTTTTIAPQTNNSCQFEYPGTGVIDLTTLGRTDGIAAYPDNIPVSGSNYKYSYNPCKPFSEGGTCINVAVCQVSMDGQYTFVLGTQGSAQWSPGSGLGIPPQISYSSGEKTVFVSLICGNNESNLLEALGEGPENAYKFRLTHKCACWNGCVGRSGGGGGAIGGGALFILTLVLAFVYSSGFFAY